ncbi:hypothetical protein WQQ_09590 [Hydrocarboniphaga effusa AP103]|uniref:Uncharacterized protein n=1 Tax=Hydrocarboniphaga effusa AP103 TaxID=1172194 RepID=I7ZGG3_9GAMM|nr:hypothetical protein WQQ_09590 [Hydrocarboniphaga effusa AP103]
MRLPRLACRDLNRIPFRSTDSRVRGPCPARSTSRGDSQCPRPISPASA